MFAVVEGKVGLSGHACRHVLFVNESHFNFKQNKSSPREFSLGIGSMASVNSRLENETAPWMEPNSKYDNLYLVACSYANPTGCKDVVGQHCSTSKKIPTFSTADCSEGALLSAESVANGTLVLPGDTSSSSSFHLFRRSSHVAAARSVLFENPQLRGPIGIHFRPTEFPPKLDDGEEQEADGIGIWVDTVDVNSPAMKQDVRVGERLVAVNDINVENATLAAAISTIRNEISSSKDHLTLHFRDRTTWHRGGDLLLSRVDGFYAAVYGNDPSATTTKDSGLGAQQSREQMFLTFAQKLQERGIRTDARKLFEKRFPLKPDSTLPWLSQSSFSRSLSDLGFEPTPSDPAGEVSQFLLATGNGRYWAVIDRSMLQWAWGLFEQKLLSQQKTSSARARHIRVTESDSSKFVWENLSGDISQIDGSTAWARASHLSSSRHPIMIKYSVSRPLPHNKSPVIVAGAAIDLEIAVCVDSEDEYDEWNFDNEDDLGEDEADDDSDSDTHGVTRHILYREGSGWPRLDEKEDLWIRSNGGLNVWIR